MAKPLLGIVLGDSAGIGPEIVAKACADDMLTPFCVPVLIGDTRILEMGQRIAGVKFQVKEIRDASEALNVDEVCILNQNNIDSADVKMGEISAVTGKASGDDILTALKLCRDKCIKGFVYAPLNKAALQYGGYDFSDEHRLMAHYLEWNSFGEVNVVKNLWTSRVTSHIPIKDISKTLTIDNILSAIKLIHNTLLKAKIKFPRIAVAALNPHAGENGLCGTEEILVIAPAIQKAKEEGINVSGPYSADTIFINAFNGLYDAVVTMYHDQGQIALKLMRFELGVTVGAGFPYAITTPAHGTAFDIAGKGIAKPDAFAEAVRIASLMAE